MSEEKELKKFISGDENVDYSKVLQEIKNMAYISARRIGRIVDKHDVDEVSSCLFTFLWENRDRFPVSEEEVFSKLKRIIYNNCSLTNEIGGFDLSFDSVFEKDEKSPVEILEKNQEEKSKFLKDIDLLFIPDNLSSEYKKIVLETDIQDLYDLSSTDSLLGNMLLSFLMKTNSEVQYKKTLFSLSKREEEVMFKCFSLKIVKPWIIPSYILWGQSFFISSISFLGPVILFPFEKYFKNLFFSIRVFCGSEKYSKELGLEDALRYLSRKYNIRMRDIKRRHAKILRMMEKFDSTSSLYVSQIRADLESFYRKGRSQLCFDFMV
jgi:hypothetical protein